MYGPLPHTGLPFEAKHRDEKFSLQLPNHLRSKGNPGTAPFGVHIGPFESCPRSPRTADQALAGQAGQDDEARTARRRPPHSIRGTCALNVRTPPHHFTHAPFITLQGRLHPQGPGCLHDVLTGCRLRQTPRRKSNRSSEITHSLLTCESGCVE